MAKKSSKKQKQESMRAKLRKELKKRSLNVSGSSRLDNSDLQQASEPGEVVTDGDLGKSEVSIISAISDVWEDDIANSDNDSVGKEDQDLVERDEANEDEADPAGEGGMANPLSGGPAVMLPSAWRVRHRNVLRSDIPGELVLTMMPFECLYLEGCVEVDAIAGICRIFGATLTPGQPAAQVLTASKRSRSPLSETALHRGPLAVPPLSLCAYLPHFASSTTQPPSHLPHAGQGSGRRRPSQLCCAEPAVLCGVTSPSRLPRAPQARAVAPCDIAAPCPTNPR
jgi:hypothetical protein